jgi:riboflavin kinase/FMN adenylyltransferase
MQFYETYKDLPAKAQGQVVVIGNFDGVHRGHGALLQKARSLAAAEDTGVAVLTFEPHPRMIFQPDDPPFRITPPALKKHRLQETGVDILYQLNFDWAFASQGAEDFVKKILVEGLRPAHVVVGYDFRFGQLRKGSAETIKAAGIPVTVVAEVGGVSSTGIRQALRHGDLKTANALLGWEWEIHGTVVKGDQRGRTLGFPTANFSLGAIVHPGYGVYAARVQVAGEDIWRPAAVNIGIRPMFETREAQVESYIFDFDREIYGQVLKVRPVQFLRGEAKFKSVDDLVVQMKADCTQAREILKD